MLPVQGYNYESFAVCAIGRGFASRDLTVACQQARFAKAAMPMNQCYESLIGSWDILNAQLCKHFAETYLFVFAPQRSIPCHALK